MSQRQQVMLLDDHAHRGYKGCKEAGDHQQVADVEGGGRCQGARPQEGEGSWDAGEDWQVGVKVCQHVSTDHGHAQQELQNPEDFDHFEKPLLLHRIATFSGTPHTASASHFCNGDWLTNEVGLLNWLTLAWLAGWGCHRLSLLAQFLSSTMRQVDERWDMQSGSTDVAQMLKLSQML